MTLSIVTAPALPSGYISFEYSRGVRALIGQWSARVVAGGGSPLLGGSWSVPGFMEDGIITEVTVVGTVDGQNVYDLQGYDAGFRLMKSPPLAHQITSSELGNVIKEIAGFCGLASDVTLEGYSELDFRHCVQGQTAANAILDLAMLGGSIAFITPSGTLRVSPPLEVDSIPGDHLRLGNAAQRALDLEGYASAVLVILHRRGDAAKGPEQEDAPEGRMPWTGTTPPALCR